MGDTILRPLASIAEIQAAVDLQRDVWQAEDRDLVPATEIVAARSNGGVVLGAWSGSRLVGFTFSMIGRRSGRVYQYSRMLAVHPEWRGHGLGAALKLAQKEASLAAGDRWMEWTFDPLEGRNANLNVARLGVRVRHYERDFYGARTSRFDLGIPTDRVRAEWDLEEDLDVT
ncbi:MAG TPA: GNAT family N-acetyltransferase, partial [Candidatus Eisenbacteria bacterium]